ncbi:MAG: cytochrome c oxidase assembly protein [Candidatus Binatia bacterium]
MPRFVKESVLFALTVAILALPILIWIGNAPNRSEPVEVVTKYLKFLYARDFRRAYQSISAADRQLKTQNDYVRERGPFDGFAHEVARKLSGFIEIRPITQQIDGTQNRVRLALRLPDAEALSDLVLEWDENRLKALPRSEQRRILATLDRLARAEKLPMIEGEEEFILVREGSKWKVFLDWAAGVQVKFDTTLPANGGLVAQPTIKETIARSGDLFTIGFKVKNTGAGEVLTRIAHRVAPKELAEYLDLVECALLLPVRLQPGEEQIYNSTYIVRGDLPDGNKTLDVTYEFKVEN